MIVLDTTTRTLEIVLGGAVTTNQLPFVASYQDSTVAPPATNQGASNNTTAVTLVAAPASGAQRRVKFLSIYNADTVAATVTVRLNDNATLRIIVSVTLNSGSSLLFTQDGGWQVIPASASGGGGSFISAIAAKSADFTVATGDVGTLYQITTGSSTVTAALPSAGSAGPHWCIFLEKADTGSGLIATSAAAQNSSLLSLMERYDIVMIWSDGTNYYAGSFPGSFDADGTLLAQMYAIASLKI